jgi:hypothetical protein
MIIDNRIGLKGQLILAQGNPDFGRRPGLEGEQENRPLGNLYKSKSLISDDRENLLFPGNAILQFRPK